MESLLRSNTADTAGFRRDISKIRRKIADVAAVKIKVTSTSAHDASSSSIFSAMVDGLGLLIRSLEKC